MAKTVKECMKGKEDKYPLTKTVGDVLKKAVSKKNVKSVKVKVKMT